MVTAIIGIIGDGEGGKIVDCGTVDNGRKRWDFCHDGAEGSIVVKHDGDGGGANPNCWEMYTEFGERMYGTYFTYLYKKTPNSEELPSSSLLENNHLININSE